MVVIAALSMIGTIIVSYLMFKNKVLLQHPNTLILGMCLSEGIAAYNGVLVQLGSKNVICHFQLGVML